MAILVYGMALLRHRDAGGAGRVRDARVRTRGRAN